MPIVDRWLGDSPGLFLTAVEFSVWSVPEDEDGTTGEPFELPNIEFLRATVRCGGESSTAHFRYVFGQGSESAPDNPEQALSLDYDFPLTVHVDDLILVRAVKPSLVDEFESPYQNVFYGRALAFAMIQSGQTEEVQILCVGKERDLRDNPIGGAIYRNASKPTTPKGQDLRTSLVAHFNPKGIANRTPGGYESNPNDNAERAYPVFLDPSVSYGVGDSRNPDFWTLPDGVEYILYTENTKEQSVTNPDKTDLDALLQAYEPTTPNAVINFDDPATYTKKPILIDDQPVDTQDIMGAVKRLINDKGFNTRFKLETPDDGKPEIKLDIFIPQAEPIHDIWLQPRGTMLDSALSNFSGGNVSRDVTEAIPRWVVEGALIEYEVTFLLAPGFPVVAADAATPQDFNLTSTGYISGSNVRKYREFIFDEAGLGHWTNTPGGAQVLTPTTLDSVFGVPVSSVPQYVQRLRKPLPKLLYQDAQGRPMKALLEYTTDARVTGIPKVYKDSDYSGLSPVVAWYPIQHGWELMKDRIGFRVTCQNPNNWAIGNIPNSTGPKVIRLVEALATPDAAWNPAPVFRLTCVIQHDKVVSGIAEPTVNSIIKRTVTRKLDARQRLKKQIALKRSRFNTTANDVVTRDDSARALAEAKALQLATSSGVMNGDVEIPYYTDAYPLGERIGSVNGRSLSFRTDGGDENDAPLLPNIAGITIVNQGKQSTVLHLSDVTTARRHYRSSGARRGRS